MLTLKSKNNYSEHEISALHELLWTALDELCDYVNCTNLRCKDCPYKHLCKDLNDLKKHIEKEKLN